MSDFGKYHQQLLINFRPSDGRHFKPKTARVAKLQSLVLIHLLSKLNFGFRKFSSLRVLRFIFFFKFCREWFLL